MQQHFLLRHLEREQVLKCVHLHSRHLIVKVVGIHQLHSINLEKLLRILCKRKSQDIKHTRAYFHILIQYYVRLDHFTRVTICYNSFSYLMFRNYFSNKLCIVCLFFRLKIYHIPTFPNCRVLFVLTEVKFKFSLDRYIHIHIYIYIKKKGYSTVIIINVKDKDNTLRILNLIP